MAQEYPIPKCLWESLDAVLYSKGISMAKEIAKELKVPVQPLLALLKKEEGAKFIIAPDSDTNTYQCQAIIQNNSTLMRCRSATLGLVAKFCGVHERLSKDVPTNLLTVRRVITAETIYMANNNVVYTLNGYRSGVIYGNKLKIFQIEEA